MRQEGTGRSACATVAQPILDAHRKESRGYPAGAAGPMAVQRTGSRVSVNKSSPSIAGGRQNTLLGTIRELARSPAIVVKTWFS